MEFNCETLDDVLIGVYPELINASANTARRGATKEVVGVSIAISNPRARLSRSEARGKPFSALGELLWYLTRSNRLDFIQSYIRKYVDESEDGETVRGAYGPRLFDMRGVNQLENVVQLIEKRRSTRRAVIQLFNAEDLDDDYKEVPCTTTLQFLLRDNRLHLIVSLRSNDAYMGLPHDVFCFTMIQEMVAKRLGAALGEYRQYVGSMHLYDEDEESARRYIDEGYQKIAPMPEMPAGDPFEHVPALLSAERRIRAGEPVAAAEVFADSYWADIIRLLQVFFATGNPVRIDELTAEFDCKAYRTYLYSRKVRPLPFRPDPSLPPPPST